MYPQSNVAKMWNRSTKNWFGPSAASISLNFMPMSHVMGRGTLYGTLGNGGTAYFAAKSDLSTLLEDLRLVRPTELNFVPRIWEMLYGEYQSEVGRRISAGADREAVESQVLVELRQELLGGRYIFAMTGSAPTSPELRTWVESLLEMHLMDGYGSTEAGMVLLDGEIQRPPVIDYKLVDVPDLGYFATDRPHPRGELLLKTPNMFPGYYKRAETTANVFDADGYYRTGDVFAEVGPDQLVYVDRRNNVLEARTGRIRHPGEAGGGVRQQPAGPPDLRLRQQRPALPARGCGADRGCVGRQRYSGPQAADRRVAAERRATEPACSPTRCHATSSSRPRRLPWRTVC